MEPSAADIALVTEEIVRASVPRVFTTYASEEAELVATEGESATGVAAADGRKPKEAVSAIPTGRARARRRRDDERPAGRRLEGR